MFFDSWGDLLRVVVVGGLAYGGLIIIMRISGKRTLAKMNAFDFIVTIALGSTLATALLSSDVSLAEGLLSFVVLAGLQYVMAIVSINSRGARRVIRAQPRLLLIDGIICEDAARAERVAADEIMAALRGAGYGDPQSVAAVVLETDGSFSVIAKEKAGSRSALNFRV